MQRVADFQNPAPQHTQEAQHKDEWTDRYGILVGGVREIPWSGVGEMSIRSGDQTIYRRVWMKFTRIQVGRRNEYDGALEQPATAIQKDWAVNSDRVVPKSPRACSFDVLASHKEQGYCVPNVLIGHPDPQSLTDKVWPREIRDTRRLFEHIQYFETFQTDDEQEATLVSELLEAAYACRNYLQEYTRGIKTELTSKNGLKSLNLALEEMFHELGEPLPENKSALVAAEMGRQIVDGVRTDGRKDDAIIGALNAITSRLERLETPATSGNGGNATTEEATVNSETSNTQPRRGRLPKSQTEE